MIEPKKLKVTDMKTGKVYMNGELYQRIKVEDSTWTVEDRKKVIFSLEKAEENIWKTVIIGDCEIDTSKVENSKHLHEFDDETQGALRKILYEQNRKNNGLPTTEEEEQMEVMKRAWNQPGSPFEGTPFDPSKVNIPSGQNFGNKNRGK